jgi:predicted nuclease of restriction endonuclease-like RecB superfamily
MEEEKVISKIKTSRIHGEDGCVIIFITDDNVVYEDKVMINFEDEQHYFEVNDIKITDDNKLLVEANEVGYWASKFNKKKNFDLRSLSGIDILLVKDKSVLSKIDEMSLRC